LEHASAHGSDGGRAIAGGVIMDKNGFSSFLLGLGVGIGIGILFAPKSGSETRQLIKEKAEEGGEYLKQRTGELRESADELVDKGRDLVQKQRENLSDALEAGKQAYRDAVGHPQAKSEA
jgi:gas vesicle protein